MNTVGIGRMINVMDTELIHMVEVVANTKENGRRTTKMEPELIHGTMVINTKENGRMETRMDSELFFVWEDGKLISGGSCDENSNNNTGSQGNNTFPENWKEGINNKGWVIMKGSHGHEGKIPDTKKAIEFIQTKVGLSGDDVDGLYGSNTAKKVWNYQENNGLKPDGKVGKNTLAKMLS
jgi:murein L,D-transpeptidase YcbB/YkuD